MAAVCEAAGDEAGDPGPAGGARQGAAGVRADAERTHTRTQTQVWHKLYSSLKKMWFGHQKHNFLNVFNKKCF